MRVVGPSVLAIVEGVRVVAAEEIEGLTGVAAWNLKRDVPGSGISRA